MELIEEIFYLFVRLGPAPHQIAFPELWGASPRCLKQRMENTRKGWQIRRGLLLGTRELLVQAITWTLTRATTEKNVSSVAYLKSSHHILFFLQPAIGFHCMIRAPVKTVAYSLAKINECIEFVELNTMAFSRGQKPKHIVLKTGCNRNPYLPATN